MLTGAVHYAFHANPVLANPMGAQVVSGGVQIENAQIVGKAIASELAGRINRRQML